MYIFVQSQALRERERERVMQQVAVFTGFPGDETRAVVEPVRWSPTPLPLPRQRNRRHHRRHPHSPFPPPPSFSPSPPLDLTTLPLNGHKAPVRNLRVGSPYGVAAAAAVISPRPFASVTD